MSDSNALLHARRGARYRITGLDRDHVLPERMMALGLREGALIEIISHSCMRGPVTVRAGRSTVAVGRSMASHILIEPLEPDS